MINIDWQAMPPKNIKKEDAEGSTEEVLYFPRITRSRRLEDKEFFEYASRHHAKWDDYILQGAVGIVVEALAEQLQQGNTVCLSELGTFRLQISADTDINGDKRSQTKHVRISGIHFTPSQYLLQQVGAPRFRWQPDGPSSQRITDEAAVDAIRSWLSTHDTITRREISDCTRLRRTAATNLIKRLLVQGILQKSGRGKNVVYTLTR